MCIYPRGRWDLLANPGQRIDAHSGRYDASHKNILQKKMIYIYIHTHTRRGERERKRKSARERERERKREREGTERDL